MRLKPKREMPMKSFILGLLTLTAAVFPATAEEALPAVASMSCKQLEAELTVSGMQVAGQMNSGYLSDLQGGAAEIQAMNDAAMAKVPGMTATSIACAAGNLAACAATDAQGAQAQAEAEKNTPRAEAIAKQGVSGALASMQGMDIGRMQALVARAESLNCPMPD